LSVPLYSLALYFLLDFELRIREKVIEDRQGVRRIEEHS